MKEAEKSIKISAAATISKAQAQQAKNYGHKGIVLSVGDMIMQFNAWAAQKKGKNWLVDGWAHTSSWKSTRMEITPWQLQMER